MNYTAFRTKAVAATVVSCLLLLFWRFNVSLVGGGGSLIASSNTTTSNEEDIWPEAGDKVIVMAKMKIEDTDWVINELPDWQHAIYHVDESNNDTRFRVPKNKGRESMAYLTYVIDHYDHLPSTIAFIHPHKDSWPAAWHTDAQGYRNTNSLNSLRLEFVQEHGYANLRCIHNPGCPDEIQIHRATFDEERVHEHAMPAAWAYMFGDNSTVPEIIATPCCSQFAVSAKQVRERPREHYVRFRQWVLDSPLDDYTTGRVLEYLWHIVFGRDAVHCPDLGSCWCDQFGRC